VGEAPRAADVGFPTLFVFPLFCLFFSFLPNECYRQAWNSARLARFGFTASWPRQSRAEDTP